MRRPFLFILSILFSLCAVLEFQAQAPYPPQSQATPAKPAIDAAKLVDDWLTRLNGLGSWYISPEGKEVGREDAVNKMMEMYGPDAIAEVPPHDDDQIGPVMLRGNAYIRKWVDKVSATQVKLLYVQKRQTQKQFEGEKLIYTTQLPWGGMGISFEIIGAWSRRVDRRKFTGPGTVFMQVSPDGKIQRLRLYLTEISEVVAL